MPIKPAGIPNSGSGVFSDLTATETIGTWASDTIELIITEETTGKIQVGIQSFQSGSGSNARVFFDNVKLISLEPDTVKLQSLVDSATVMLANRESIPQGSTAYTDLETVVSEAQLILDHESATFSQITDAKDHIIAAIDGVNSAIFLFSLETATLENPIDITQLIINPDFETNGGSTEGWKTMLGIIDGESAVFDGASNTNHVLDGDPTSSTRCYQTVTGIPSGVYQLKAVARGREETNADNVY